MLVSAATLTVEEKISTFYWGSYRNPYPPMEERKVMPAEEVAQLQQEWAAAKASGLLLDREALLRKISFGRYLAYSNPEIIQIAVELFLVEYECHKKHRSPSSFVVEDVSLAECSHEAPIDWDEEGPDERWADYDGWVYSIGLSTFSPEIFDVVAAASFLAGPAYPGEYLSRVNTEIYLDAVLNGNLEMLPSGEGAWLNYSIRDDLNSNNFMNSVANYLVTIFLRRPELQAQYRDAVLTFIENLGTQSVALGLEGGDKRYIERGRERIQRLVDSFFEPANQK